MTSTCRSDPVVCIDFMFLLIGEILKDWTTMAMMAVLLGLLLKHRSDTQKARDDIYAKQMDTYIEGRKKANEENAS